YTRRAAAPKQRFVPLALLTRRPARGSSMRQNLLGSLSVLLTSAGMSFAQTPVVGLDGPSMPVVASASDEKGAPKNAPPPGAAKPNPALPTAPTSTGDSCWSKVDCSIPYSECAPRFWARGEYLLRWFKSSPKPAP